MPVVSAGNAMVAGEQSKTRMVPMTIKHVDSKGIPKSVADSRRLKIQQEAGSSNV